LIEYVMGVMPLQASAVCLFAR